MSMIDAFRFLGKCRTDGSFRQEAYELESENDFTAWTERSGFSFTWNEIDDAFRSLKLRAVDEYEAEEIDELKQWYQLMSGQSDSPCASCGTKNACGLGAVCGTAST